MVLGGKVDPQDDPFNVFWNKLEKMLDNLSQPVAFATIPLTASADGPKEAPAGPKAPISVSGNNTLGLHINGSHVEQESIEDQLSRAMEDDDELLSGVLVYSPSFLGIKYSIRMGDGRVILCHSFCYATAV